MDAATSLKLSTMNKLRFVLYKYQRYHCQQLIKEVWEPLVNSIAFRPTQYCWQQAKGKLRIKFNTDKKTVTNNKKYLQPISEINKNTM